MTTPPIEAPLAGIAARLSRDPAQRPAACVIAVLLKKFLRSDPADPFWPDRDRLFMTGRAASLIPRLAELTGAACPAETVEAPANAYLGLAVGAALAERILAQRYGRSLAGHWCFLLADHACLMDGPALDAAYFAGSAKLTRLIVFCGDAFSAHDAAIWAAFGWAVRRLKADGLKADQSESATASLAATISAAQRSRRPTLILASACDPGEAAPARGTLWGKAGLRAAARRAWLKRLARHPRRDAFLAGFHGRASQGSAGILLDPSLSAAAAARHVITQMTDENIYIHDIKNLYLSDDEAPKEAISKTALACGHILCGVALHGGLLPVALCDAGDPSLLLSGLRIAAANALPLLVALSEKSCAPEDVFWRGIAGLYVFRPADSAETEEACALALRHLPGPSLLLLSPDPPNIPPPERRGQTAAGAYPRQTTETCAVTLIASGGELSFAQAVANLLREQGVAANLVSLPCWALFLARAPESRDIVLGEMPRFYLTRGTGFGAERWLGDGHIIDLTASLSPKAVAAVIVADGLRRPEAPPLDTAGG
jgi:transketolase